MTLASFRFTPPADFKLLVPKYRSALRNAINDTLRDGQLRGQRLVSERLTVRSSASRGFLERLVKFEKFDRATTENLIGEMGLQDSGTGTKRKSAQLLIKLTQGGTFTRPADAPFYIPTVGPFAARANPAAQIPRALFPKALRLQDALYTVGKVGKKTHVGQKLIHQGKRGVILRGKLRTFAVDPQFHRPVNQLTLGIYQRRGRGNESETGVLWWYRTRIRLPKKFPFVETVMPVIEARFPVNLELAIRQLFRSS